MALLFIEIPAASLVFHDGNCLTQGLNSYDTPGQAAKTPACIMSFRVKERENGIKRYEGHIKASFENSVVNQVIRTPFLKRSSTSNDNLTQTRDFVNHFQDSLVFECDNTLVFSEEPSFEVARACFHHYEHAKQGGETGTVAQPST